MGEREKKLIGIEDKRRKKTKSKNQCLPHRPNKSEKKHNNNRTIKIQFVLFICAQFVSIGCVNFLVVLAFKERVCTLGFSQEYMFCFFNAILCQVDIELFR